MKFRKARFSFMSFGPWLGSCRPAPHFRSAGARGSQFNASRGLKAGFRSACIRSTIAVTRCLLVSQKHRTSRGGHVMGIQYDISRRHMLAMSAATVAMSAMGIEQFDPALDKIISTSEPIKEIASGFGGELGPAEGPVWIKEGGYLLFSDIHNNRRMKYTLGQGVSVFLEPTNRANGLTRDLQGRVLACEHDTRRVTRRELDGSLTVIASSFQGRRFNRPNDV